MSATELRKQLDAANAAFDALRISNETEIKQLHVTIEEMRLKFTIEIDGLKITIHKLETELLSKNSRILELEQLLERMRDIER